jgi:hypothetical protein
MGLVQKKASTQISHPMQSHRDDIGATCLGTIV